MSTNFAFSDFFKNSLDLNQLFSTQRRNIETVSAVNQTVVESAQAISRRQAEVARDNVESILKASKDILSGNTPEASLAKQSDLAKSIFENTLANIREIVETATKSSFEAFDILNQRAAESLAEISKAAGQAPAAKKSNKQ
ncbi:MAG: TIGR01841 family phasin [Rickettsiales bacterium]|nr:TIGR01841 family phasin [Rickettsiales bacterium]